MDTFDEPNMWFLEILQNEKLKEILYKIIKYPIDFNQVYTAFQIYFR